ncbi:MAG: homocysteine S-methyltransferase family protein [Chloroflexota bacterium]
MNRYDKLMERLKNGERILIDGATGTEVERRGVPQIEGAWNGGGTLSHPDTIRGIHEDYIRCGAQLVISNTFATSRHILQAAGVEEHFETINRRAVELACEARDSMGNPDVLVAGGVTHWSFADQAPSLDQLRTNIEDEVAIMADTGAELLMLEMMIDIERMLVTLEAAQTSGLPVWVGFTCEVDDEGVVRLWDGPTLADAITAIQDKNVPLISIMHTDVKYVDAALEVLQANWSKPIGVYAHSGDYVEEEAQWVFDDVISPEAYATAATRWLQSGVQVIGGCCGIGTEHITRLKTILTG